jgi:EAL domain-containing protein (putative c-di-GMP-specific phosphodiesterase class I)
VLSGPTRQLPNDIVRNADIAMYQAKRAGKARYSLYDASMHTHAVARLQLESDLRSAFERHEFYLEYQPILEVTTQRIAGFEALLRWRHPLRGAVSPAEFIPVAEDTGLIVPLGEQVLTQACRQIVNWQAQFPADPPFTLAVNLSARQFRQAQLVQQVEQVLRETGLEPGQLNLEVTESVLIEDVAATSAIMSSLRALGVRLHIDDFGTGYSSLGYLYRFPFDALKIDRTFIARLDGDLRNNRMVQNIVALAHDLGLGVIAEGAETSEQLAHIAAMGCEQVQGFAVSKPLGTAAITTLLAAGRPVKPFPMDDLVWMDQSAAHQPASAVDRAAMRQAEP